MFHFLFVLNFGNESEKNEIKAKAVLKFLDH